MRRCKGGASYKSLGTSDLVMRKRRKMKYKRRHSFDVSRYIIISIVQYIYI
jgi:hypothetical protein